MVFVLCVGYLVMLMFVVMNILCFFMCIGLVNRLKLKLILCEFVCEIISVNMLLLKCVIVFIVLVVLCRCLVIWCSILLFSRWLRLLLMILK